MTQTTNVVAPSTVETQVVEEDQAVGVLVTCHDPATPTGPDDSRTTHLLAPTGVPLISESASVVVTDARAATDEQEFDVLNNAVRHHPGAMVVGAVTSSRSTLVWVRVQPFSVWEPTGYTVTVRSKEPGPAELYPSVIYGWARWWLERLDVPEGYPRGVLLQRPPFRLDARMHDDAYDLDVSTTVGAGRYEMRDPQDPTEWR